MKPRARWCPLGVGYWVVRTVERGTVIQGVAKRLDLAYCYWVSNITSFNRN